MLVRFAEGARDFSLPNNVQAVSGSRPFSHTTVNGARSVKMKQRRYETDHSSSSNTKFTLPHTYIFMA
jgi:hypothetical protein